MTCVLGLDIGGSTTRGRVALDGVMVAEARGASASLTAAGRTDAEVALRDVLGQLAPVLSRAPDAVCAGAAGSEVGGGARWLEELLARLTGGSRVAVVSDVALLLPAAGHRDGIAVVSGTGSVVHGRHGEQVARAGGWGYLLGDEGGGYRLVVEALRAALWRRDHGELPGALGAALVDAAEGGGGDGGQGDRDRLDRLVAALHADPRPRRWAALAPTLLRCEDPAVDAILAAGAAVLADQAVAVATRLGLLSAPIVTAGGLLDDPRARTALDRALAAALPGWPVQPLTAPPVAGAVTLAQQMA